MSRRRLEDDVRKGMDKRGAGEGDYVVKSGKVGSRDAAESRDSFWAALGDKVCLYRDCERYY